MISSISLSNYRKFRDKITFDTAPITIFTGPNNSGKSSVLESLLLLRDSMSTSNLDYLDFMGGRHHLCSFHTTLNRQAENEVIKFGLGFTMRRYYKPDDGVVRNSILPQSGRPFSPEFFGGHGPEHSDDYQGEEVEAIVEFSYRKGFARRAKRVDLRFREDEEPVLSFLAGLGDGVAPRPKVREGEESPEDLPSSCVCPYLNGPLLKQYIEGREEALAHAVGPNVSEEHIQRLLEELNREVTFVIHDPTPGLVSLSRFPKLVRRIDYTGPFTTAFPLEDQAEKIEGGLEPLEGASLALKWLLLPFVQECVDRVERELAMSNITSLRNLRAGSHPFYRRESIPPGFAQLLDEAAGVQIDPPEKWLKTFKIGDGLSVERKVEIDGYTVQIERDGEAFPLSALGEGSAQVLPLILYQNYGLGGDRTSHLILQEPEANLHPDLQAKLADLFMALIGKGQDERGPRSTGAFSRTGRLIVETHSEYLIRRLQLLVARGKLSTNDVVIHYLGIGEEKGPELRQIEIDEYGQLTQPFGPGFFDEATKLMIDLFEYGSDN